MMIKRTNAFEWVLRKTTVVERLRKNIIKLSGRQEALSILARILMIKSQVELLSFSPEYTADVDRVSLNRNIGTVEESLSGELNQLIDESTKNETMQLLSEIRSLSPMSSDNDDELTAQPSAPCNTPVWGSFADGAPRTIIFTHTPRENIAPPTFVEYDDDEDSNLKCCDPLRPFKFFFGM